MVSEIQWDHSEAGGEVALAGAYKLRVFELAGIGWTGSVRLASLPKGEAAPRPKEWPTKPQSTKEAARVAALELFADLKASGESETVEPGGVPKRRGKRGPYQKRAFKLDIAPDLWTEFDPRKINRLGKRAFFVVHAARRIAADSGTYDVPIKTPELRAVSGLGRSAFFEGMKEAQTAGLIYNAGRGRCFVKPMFVKPEPSRGHREFQRRDIPATADEMRLIHFGELSYDEEGDG